MAILDITRIEIIVIVLSAVFFYVGAEIERTSKLRWGGLSILFSLISKLLSRGVIEGVIGVVLSQIVLFFGIMVFKLLFRKK